MKKCLFGHKWNGCKCERCGEIKEHQHDFRPVENTCRIECILCGRFYHETHNFVNGYCSRCGKLSDHPVSLRELTPKESQELRPVLLGSLLSMGETVSLRPYISRLPITYHNQKTYKSFAGRKDLSNMVYDAFTQLGNDRLSLEEAVFVVAAVRKTIKMLNGLISKTDENDVRLSSFATLTQLDAPLPDGPMRVIAADLLIYNGEGIVLNPYEHYYPILGTVGALGSAAEKTEHAVIAFLKETARRAQAAGSRTDAGDQPDTGFAISEKEFDVLGLPLSKEFRRLLFDFILKPSQKTEIPKGASLETYVRNLLRLYKNHPAGFLTSEALEVRQIGQALDDMGGMDMMLEAHRLFSEQNRPMARNLEMVWDGIGAWRG